MTNSERVEIVYKKHKDWLSAVCYNLTQDTNSAQDLLQDVLIHLLEMKDLHKIVYDNTDLNLFYIYKIVKSKFLNNEKSKKKLEIGELNEDIFENTSENEYDFDGDENTERLLQLVNETLEKDMYWFDSKLFLTYVNEDHSIQSLHECTHISRNTIFNSLTKTKKYIKQKAIENDLHS